MAHEEGRKAALVSRAHSSHTSVCTLPVWPSSQCLCWLTWLCDASGCQLLSTAPVRLLSPVPAGARHHRLHPLHHLLLPAAADKEVICGQHRRYVIGWSRVADRFSTILQTSTSDAMPFKFWCHSMYLLDVGPQLLACRFVLRAARCLQGTRCTRSTRWRWCRCRLRSACLSCRTAPRRSGTGEVQDASMPSLAQTALDNAGGTCRLRHVCRAYWKPATVGPC